VTRDFDKFSHLAPHLSLDDVCSTIEGMLTEISAELKIELVQRRVADLERQGHFGIDSR
jgi:hypothetical protein